MNQQTLKHLMMGAALVVACGCGAAPEAQGVDVAADESVGETTEALSSTFGYIAAEEIGGVTPAQALAQMPKLKGTGIAMVQDWKTSLLDDTARWKVVQQGKVDGTPVFPWLVLPPGTPCNPSNPALPCDLGATKPANYAKTGYYPNATNYSEWITQALALMDLWKTKGYAPTTLVVDFEMRDTSWEQFKKLSGTLATDVITVQNGLGQFLQAEINRPRYALALAAYKNFVNQAHAKGWKVHMTTLIHVLDDYLDGDDAIRQAFNTPIDNTPTAAGAVAWDAISFQAYRTLYQSATGISGTPYFVYSYGSTARTYFGSKAALDIGLAEQYDSTSLRQDVGAAVAIGIAAPTVGVYSLKGVINAPGQAWFGAPIAYFPFPDLLTPAVVSFDVALDSFLH